MKRLPRALAALLTVGVTSCSFFAPYEAGAPGQDRYAVCYIRPGASAQQIEQIMAQECTGKTRPHVVEQGLSLSACPILTPIHAVFTCTAP